MLTIQFQDLVTVEEWADALNKIINEGKTAVQNNDSANRIHVQALLTDFTNNAPAFAISLVNIARQAAHDIFISQVDSSLKALASRDAELNAAVAQLTGVTAKANKSARSIQFEEVISVLDKAKVAVDTLKKAEEALTKPDQNLLDKIKSLSVAIEELAKLKPSSPA